MNKEILFIDMDGVLCDFYKAKKEKISDKVPYPQSQYGFFRNLEPIEGALETVKWLQESFDVYILTAPSIHNPFSYSEKREWIEKYLGFEMCKKLIISPNKGLLKGQYLIDDNIHEGFEGKHLHFGTLEFKDWQAIKIYFTFKKLQNAINNEKI